jgi:hypothetical protein
MALFRTPLPRLGSLLVLVPTLWLGRQRKPSRMVRTTRRLVGSLFPFVCSILSVMVQSSCSFHQTARGNYITAAFRTYRRKCHLKTSSSYQAYTWPLQLISSFWISLLTTWRTTSLAWVVVPASRPRRTTQSPSPSVVTAASA